MDATPQGVTCRGGAGLLREGERPWGGSFNITSACIFLPHAITFNIALQCMHSPSDRIVYLNIVKKGIINIFFNFARGGHKKNSKPGIVVYRSCHSMNKGLKAYPFLLLLQKLNTCCTLGLIFDRSTQKTTLKSK